MTDWVTLKDQLNLTLRPIDAWPGKMTPAWSREKGPFSAPLKDTLQTLRKELNALNAKAIVLQIAIQQKHLRLDGLPRAGATAEHPGVILAFNSSKGNLRLWFDRFSRWENNLRAIALHLEHLRLATLYGVGDDGQAYRGWQQLPPVPEQQPQPASPRSDVEKAVIILLASANITPTPEACRAANNPDEARRIIREAQRASHPDSGGDSASFHNVTQAAELLRKYLYL